MRVYELMEILSSAFAGAEIRVAKAISPEDLVKAEKVEDTGELLVEGRIRDVITDDIVTVYLD